ncbi:MAG: enoyl-CoA hydratase-related protein, partial [Microcystaceae cyanobacterium]
YPAIPHDESRDSFRVPALLRQLVEKGALGAKTGQGFYKKEKQQIISLNPENLDYELQKPLNLGNIETISKREDLGDRLLALYQDSGRAGTFFRTTTLAMLGYSAHRLPEIADSPAEIDRAMGWGFGWEWGPFEIWDALGFERILSDMQASNIPLPAWVKQMSQSGVTGFYDKERGVYGPNQQYIPVETPADEINLVELKSEPQHTLWQNSEAALLDLGDGVALYEFRSKGNTLSLKVVEGLSEVLDRIETEDFRGLVLGNGSQNFSGGANLGEMAMLAQTGGSDAIAQLLNQFQSLLQRVHYFPKPIVAAIQGRVLGGGTELVMACPQVVAAAESYIGLVEMSVGLIPGAGGIMRMVTWAADRAATESPSQIQPFLKAAFETIAMAKVSNSAQEAQALGFLAPTARIVMNGERRLFVAKEEVIRLDSEGYLPPPERNSIMVLGCSGRALLEQAAYIFLQGRFISEYDRYLANRLAYVMTGGDLSAPALVHENYLLQLEREMFLPLLSEQKTQERIAYLLKTKKPLRN